MIRWDTVLPALSRAVARSETYPGPAGAPGCRSPDRAPDRA
ncbi:hypothetical protein [Micromonospora sp. NPDC007230]